MSIMGLLNGNAEGGYYCYLHTASVCVGRTAGAAYIGAVAGFYAQRKCANIGIRFRGLPAPLTRDRV